MSEWGKEKLRAESGQRKIQKIGFLKMVLALYLKSRNLKEEKFQREYKKGKKRAERLMSKSGSRSKMEATDLCALQSPI